MTRFLSLGLVVAALSRTAAGAALPPTPRDHYEGWTAVTDTAQPLLVAHELALPDRARAELVAARSLRELWKAGDKGIHLEKGVGEDGLPGIVGAGNADDAQFTISKSGAWSWRKREGSCTASRVVVGPRGGLVFCEETTVLLHPKGASEVDLRPLLDDVGPFRVVVARDELMGQRAQTADLVVLPVGTDGEVDARRPGYALHAVPPPQGTGDLEGLNRYEKMWVEAAVERGAPDLPEAYSDEVRAIVQRVYREEELERIGAEALVARVRLDVAPAEGGSDGLLTSAPPLGRQLMRVKPGFVLTGMLRYQQVIGGGPAVPSVWGDPADGVAFGGLEPVFQGTWRARYGGGGSLELAPNRLVVSGVSNNDNTIPAGSYLGWANGAINLLVQTGVHTDAVTTEFGVGGAAIPEEDALLVAARARVDARFAVVESFRRTRSVGFSLEAMAYTEDTEAFTTFVFAGVTVSQASKKVQVERRN